MVIEYVIKQIIGLEKAELFVDRTAVFGDLVGDSEGNACGIIQGRRDFSRSRSVLGGVVAFF